MLRRMCDDVITRFVQSAMRRGEGGVDGDRSPQRQCRDVVARSKRLPAAASKADVATTPRGTRNLSAEITCREGAGSRLVQLHVHTLSHLCLDRQSIDTKQQAASRRSTRSHGELEYPEMPQCRLRPARKFPPASRGSPCWFIHFRMYTASREIRLT